MQTIVSGERRCGDRTMSYFYLCMVLKKMAEYCGVKYAASECIALKTAINLLIDGMRYKLQMMETPALDGPMSSLCDNESVVKKSWLQPESTLKIRHTAIWCYHRMCEACATGYVRIAHKRKDGGGNTIVSDILTSKLMLGPCMSGLLDGVLWKSFWIAPKWSPKWRVVARASKQRAIIVRVLVLIVRAPAA
jgi:hypothetical protein